VSTYIERWNILLGLIFVIVIMFMPSGLVPGCAQLWRRLSAHRKDRKTAVPEHASEPAQ
jgi:branched-chain amino acid transport system permease protein